MFVKFLQAKDFWTRDNRLDFGINLNSVTWNRNINQKRQITERNNVK